MVLWINVIGQVEIVATVATWGVLELITKLGLLPKLFCLVQEEKKERLGNVKEGFGMKETYISFRSRFLSRFVETSWILAWNFHLSFILCKAAIIDMCSYIYPCGFWGIQTSYYVTLDILIYGFSLLFNCYSCV